MGTAGGFLPPESTWAQCVHVYTCVCVCVWTVSIIQDSMLLLDQASTFTQRRVAICAQGSLQRQMRCHTGVEGQRTFEGHELIVEVQSR